MQRLIAILLGATLVSTTGHIAALHVHAYTGHEHTEHHHGPATHEHTTTTSGPHPDDDRSHVESCDPAGHAVSVAMGYTPAPRVAGAVADGGESAIILQPMPLPTVVRLSDVRVHDPPDRRQASPRAPPLDTPRLIS